VTTFFQLWAHHGEFCCYSFTARSQRRYEKLGCRRDSAGRRSLRRSRSLKVTDSVPIESSHTTSLNNTNLHVISQRSPVTVNALVLGNLCTYSHKSLLKARFCGLRLSQTVLVYHQPHLRNWRPKLPNSNDPRYGNSGEQVSLSEAKAGMVHSVSGVCTWA